jgi:hypothetical protein
MNTKIKSARRQRSNAKKAAVQLARRTARKQAEAKEHWHAVVAQTIEAMNKKKNRQRIVG